MKLFGSYLKYRIKFLITSAVVIGIFSSSYLLFDMPPIAVLYPLILIVAVGLIAMAVDFVFFIKRHNQLTQAQDELPAPKNQIEEDYQLIISKLNEEAKISQQNSSAKYTDMVEYYTVWAHQIKTPIAAMRLNLQSEDTESARNSWAT